LLFAAHLGVGIDCGEAIKASALVDEASGRGERFCARMARAVFPDAAALAATVIKLLVQ
jgi:hypothetical protein